MNRVSLKDIAERTGLSKPTVGRILAGDSGAFRVETRQKVLQAAEAMGYVRPANGLEVAGMSQTVAVVGPEIEQLRIDQGLVGAPDWTVLGCVQAVHERGLNGLTVQSANLSETLIERLVQLRPMGVLFPCFMDLRSAEPTRKLDRLRDAGIPYVVYGDPQEFAGYDRVASDHEQGSYALTRWLIEHGRRRILHHWPAPATEYWYAMRRRGYERAMREAGLEPLPDTLYQTDDRDGHGVIRNFDRWARMHAGYLAEWLVGPQRVDALLLSNDGVTPGVMEALKLFGLKANEDVAVAGYDHWFKPGVNMQPHWKEPTITVDKDNWSIGAEMLGLLLRRIEGDLPPAPQLRLVPSRLIPNRNPSEAVTRPPASGR